MVAHDGQQGPTLGRFALNTLKAKNIAVIDDSTAYGQGLADNFEATIKAGGGKIVAREHTTDKDTDFKAILTKIKGKNPDLIMFGGIDPQAGPMKKQMAELGIKAQFIGGDGMQTPNFIKLAGDSAEGAMASIPGLPKDKMPGGTEFLAKYKSQVQSRRRAVRANGLRRGDGVCRSHEAFRLGQTRPSFYRKSARPIIQGCHRTHRV